MSLPCLGAGPCWGKDQILGSFPPRGGFPLPLPPKTCLFAAPQPWLPGWSLPACPSALEVLGRCAEKMDSPCSAQLQEGWHRKKPSRIPCCSSQSLPSLNRDFPGRALQGAGAVSGHTSLLQSVPGVSLLYPRVPAAGPRQTPETRLETSAMAAPRARVSIPLWPQSWWMELGRQPSPRHARCVTPERQPVSLRPVPLGMQAALLCQQLAPLAAAALELAVWSQKAPEASPRTVAPLCERHHLTSGSKRCVNAKE